MAIIYSGNEVTIKENIDKKVTILPVKKDSLGEGVKSKEVYITDLAETKPGEIQAALDKVNADEK